MKRHTAKKTFTLIIIALLAVAIWAMAELVFIIKDLPRPESITSFQPTQSTKIYDRSGQILLYEIHGDENRTIVSQENISKYARLATIAIEDQKFFSHAALDIRGFLRALWINVKEGEWVQGGSTITQQLVKNAFLTPERTVRRKIRELILARWIEENYSKDDILTLYLNQISYGSNTYGIESASRRFFGKSIKDASLTESAVLAAMLRAPSYYSPWGNHVNELLQRKDSVLDKMKEFRFIDEEEWTRAKKEKIAFLPPTIGSIKAPHFTLMVKEKLVQKYGEPMVENGGLKVITTLDWEVQEIAEKTVREGAKHNKELYKGENVALVAQDAKTGQVLSLVGSADYFNVDIKGNFNVAAQGLRQPGSAFKPFVYLTAFNKGYPAETVVFDVPTEFTSQNPRCPAIVNFNNRDTACFHPRNFDDTFRGPVSFKQALAQSINVPSVKVLYLAGFEDTLRTAQKMGITTLNDPSRYGLSLVLGGGEVKLIDLVNAYSVLAQDGIQHTQSIILRVENDKGEILEEHHDSPIKIEEENPVRMINQILSDVSLRSGLFSSSLPLTVFEGYEVALKTGTTNDYKDAWAVGYTPSLVVGVWAGNSDNKPMQQRGGSILAAVPIWSDFLREVIHKFPAEFFVYPEPVTSSIPMLNGQYVYFKENNDSRSPHIHNILYYIKRESPLEQIEPGSQLNNPQFLNWEAGVVGWARSNIFNFLTVYNR